MSWNVSFAPPFTLHNALPVPVDITVIHKRSLSTTSTSTGIAPAPYAYPLRVHLLPNDRAPMLHLNAAQVESVSVRPEGFEMTSPLPINEVKSHVQLSPAPTLAVPAVQVSASEADLAGAWQFYNSGDIGVGGSSSGGDDTTSISLAGLLLDNNNGGTSTAAGVAGLHGERNSHQQFLLPLGPETVATVQELPPGRSTVDVSIQHALSLATGSHVVRLSCGMWIYNCIGIPLSIRNASLEDSLLAEAVAHQGGNASFLDTAEQDLIMLSIDDHVPDSWVPPLLMPPNVDGGGHGGGGFASGATPEGVIYFGENYPTPAGAGATGEGFNNGDLSYRGKGGTGASPLSTYRTGGGVTARGDLRPISSGQVDLSGSGASGLVSARTAPPGVGLAGRSLPSMSGSMMSVGRTASNADVPGLSEILDGGIIGGGGGGLGNISARSGGGGGGITPSPLNTNRSSVLGYQQGPLSSRARGIADSMDSSPTFERPSAWPSMASGLSHGAAHRLRLQLRSAATKAPPGRTFWSSTVDLDSSGGAVVTSIPSPAPAASVAAAGSTSASALRGSYPIVVTSTQVPGADGVLALCISPQFVLRNALDMPIQYKQQDSIAGEREVPPGGVRAIRWADDSLPPRLCVRVQEAGWIWSGGFQLDVPGDIFVKSRHRDRGITMLLRVDVAISTSGSAQITLSHNPAGFAPYRVENCSTETLHARQKSVREQQDVLRPYCALNYAWDEPTQPHILVLELPGARGLGNFDLDKVRRRARKERE
jgi:SHR-binding domain of vacuolar-sorting associated protein 13